MGELKKRATEKTWSTCRQAPLNNAFCHIRGRHPALELPPRGMQSHRPDLFTSQWDFAILAIEFCYRYRMPRRAEMLSIGHVHPNGDRLKVDGTNRSLANMNRDSRSKKNKRDAVQSHPLYTPFFSYPGHMTGA